MQQSYKKGSDEVALMQQHDACMMVNAIREPGNCLLICQRIRALPVREWFN